MQRGDRKDEEGQRGVRGQRACEEVNGERGELEVNLARGEEGRGRMCCCTRVVLSAVYVVTFVCRLSNAYF